MNKNELTTLICRILIHRTTGVLLLREIRKACS